MATWEGVWPWAKQADSEGVSLASKAIQPQAEEYHRAGLKGGEDLTYNRGRFQLSPAQLGQLLPCLPATTAARCVHSLSQYQGRGDEWFNPTPLVPLNSPSSPCSSSVGLPDSAASIAEWFGKGGGRKPRPQSAVAELGQINGVGINPFNSSKGRHDLCPKGGNPHPT